MLPNENSQALNLKRQQLELLRKQLQMKKDNGLAFYKPHPKQDSFHRAAKYLRRMVRCGNRFGKSVCGAAEDVAYLLGERLWYPKNDPARTLGIPQHPVKGLVICADWDKVHEIFTSQQGSGGKIWKFLPKGQLKSVHRNPSGVIDTIALHNGSMLCFDTVQSFKHNPLGSESSDWDFVHGDEPFPEEMWKAVSRGLIDRNGPAWFTLTPLQEMWINDMFFPRFDDERSKLWKDNHWCTSGSIYDNPFLTPEAIALFEATLTEDEKECRLHGIPLELTGLVYKEFNWDKHVLKNVPSGWDDFNTPPKDWPVYITIDPHLKLPQTVLFMTVSPLGHMIVFDEIYNPGTIFDVSQIINVKISERFVMSMKVDPMACTPNPVDETTILDEFGNYGLWPEKASKDKMRGILSVKEALKVQGHLLFAPNLKRTLWEISRYCYTDQNKPIDKDDHMMECLYRLVIDDPIWVDLDPKNKPFVKEIEITRPEIYD